MKIASKYHFKLKIDAKNKEVSNKTYERQIRLPLSADDSPCYQFNLNSKASP